MNKKNMKRTVAVACATILCAGACLAHPGGHGPGGPGRPGWHRPSPPSRCARYRHHAPYRHHGGAWGRGGRNFWPGFVGGVIGGAVARTIVEPAPVFVTTPPVVTTPTVVTRPVVVQQPVIQQTAVVASPVTQVQNVWVEGCYVDQVQANGAVIRVWQPGHYEQRTVVVQ